MNRLFLVLCLVACPAVAFGDGPRPHLVADLGSLSPLNQGGVVLPSPSEFQLIGGLGIFANYDADGAQALWVTDFHVEMRIGTGFQEVAVVPAGTTAWVKRGLRPHTRYVFRVRAENTAGSSGYSNRASVLTP
ncbi:MAG TPA: fibronectin type III domain-containing protein [Thermoanaerobaculia bacterium]|nr:fibronectin type III domain-containing protein [Thermoanaerobaculia bacterium]